MADSFDDITADISSSGDASAVDNAIPGTILRVKIHVENWDKEGDYDELDCGAFEIDSCDFSGPPDTMSIKAVSTPLSTSIRREEKDNAWEDTTLEAIASDIAGTAGLQLMYEVDGEIELDRVEQLQQSDLAFLQGLCHQYGVCVKVTDDQLVLFDESVYEQRPAVAVYDKSEKGGRLISYKFSQDTSGCVSSVVVDYKDPKSGKLVEAEFEPPEAPATAQRALVNARPGDLRGDRFRQTLSEA